MGTRSEFSATKVPVCMQSAVLRLGTACRETRFAAVWLHQACIRLACFVNYYTNRKFWQLACTTEAGSALLQTASAGFALALLTKVLENITIPRGITPMMNRSFSETAFPFQ